MATPAFQDHFSGVAPGYAAFRPGYPSELFDWLASAAPARHHAWDCACGSGQAKLALAERFDRITATDASAAQISHAPHHPRITWRVAPAEASGLDTASVALITVAQALHWFDLDAFYTEARRVLAPGGILAAWCYGTFGTDHREVDTLVQAFYAETLGPHWPPERRLVEFGYRDLPFPFDELPAPPLSLAQDWTLDQLLGYLASWSATARYRKARGEDPIAPLASRLTALWSAPSQTLRFTWPISLRVGRLPG